MVEFLSGSVFLYGFIPVFSVVLAVYVRIATRRSDNDRRWRKEDFAVGMDLMQLATLALLTIVAARAVELDDANKAVAEALESDDNSLRLETLHDVVRDGTDHLINASALLFALIFALWGTSFVVQQWGWRERDDLRPLVGMALPLFLGFGSILVAIGAGR